MISIYKAEAIVLRAASLLPVEMCPLQHAHGRILRQDIKSDRDQPPFDKALMDGIAFASKAWQKGQRDFDVEAILPAGVLAKALKDRTKCVRIMTGAPVPQHCDVIVPVEYVGEKGNGVTVRTDAPIMPGQFIRRRGMDAKKGNIVLRAGTQLHAPQIGVAASMGCTHISVSVRPRIAVIATGDELVDIGHPLKEHQTRLSNSYALQAMVNESGLASADLMHITDDPKKLEAKIKDILKKYDVVVLSGGVSMGAFDYVPTVLARLGVKQQFHTVAQKPGKPLWFGCTATGKPVFGLPGNPASTLVCAYRYVMPYLFKAAGAMLTQQSMTLEQQPDIKSDLVHFLPVKNGAIVSASGSGDFGGWANSDGFIEYDKNKKQSQWPYFSWRP